MIAFADDRDSHLSRLPTQILGCMAFIMKHDKKIHLKKHVLNLFMILYLVQVLIRASVNQNRNIFCSLLLNTIQYNLLSFLPQIN